MISRCRYLMWLTWRRLTQRPILSILLMLVMLYLIAALVVVVCEEVPIGNALVRIFPAFFGEVGFIDSPFLAVQIWVIIGLIASISFLAIITGKITSVLVERISKGGSMAKKVNFSGHTIICGWNYQGDRIIKELLSADVKEQRGIVILHNCEERPIKDERVEFICGDPSQDENLIRAGVMRAKSVIVLTDVDRGSNQADAEALMVVLAVESLNREVHTCVQIMNSANRCHLERAHADEIICLDQIGGCLVVASALEHGVSYVVSELLTFNLGSELYRYDGYISDKLVGRDFTEAVQILAQQRMILLAVETDYSEELRRQLSKDILHKLVETNRAVIINPQSTYEIRQGDALLLIAESEPAEL
jgi:Trk K+ transport system NAD-binding subunit